MKFGQLVAKVWSFSGASSRPPSSSVGSKDIPGGRNASKGQELRMMMLTTPAGKAGFVATDEYPYVFGVVMDWPLKEGYMTVFSTSFGTASVYTTGSFGIIGGERHDDSRNAAKAFVREANRYYEIAQPVAEYPYPRSDHVRFYLLAYDGVRMIETTLASVMNGESDYYHMAVLGQDVLTKLREYAERKIGNPSK